MRTSERGFSYLLLLFVLLLSGVALAALGENLGVGLQREREAELLWRGAEIARALDRYHAVAVSGVSRYPATLEALVEDRRLTDPRYHLRRLYLDPYSGRADWALLRDEQGGIVGVHSRSPALALARIGVPVQAIDLVADEPHPASARKEPRVSQWRFMAGATSLAATSANEPLGLSKPDSGQALPGSPSTVPTGSSR
jgi:type II secretory pathway pseudopilin PulG